MTRLCVIGVSHRTAPVEVRERVAFGEEQLPLALKQAVALPGVGEAMIVSTCNRVELYAGADGDDATVVLSRLMIEGRSLPEPLHSHLYVHDGEAALLHLFRVASSLDSMVLGEPQILGQVKEAFALATEHGTVGAYLGKALPRAFAVAKRVRTETDIARTSASIASAAVDLAEQIFGNLKGRQVLVIGAGKMGALSARHLRASGIGELIVVNRTRARADALAEQLGGRAAPWEELDALLAKVDIVICSTGATEPVITRAQVEKVMKARRGRWLFFIDIAVPRDVETRVGEVENVYLYDVDALEEVVSKNRAVRAKEADQAEEMVREEVRRFVALERTAGVVPVIKAVRARFHEVAHAEVERAMPRLAGLSEKDRAQVVALAEGIANKLLHPALTALKKDGADGERLAQALVELFGLTLEEARLMVVEEMKIATRGSALALWQANHVRDRLLAGGVAEVELLVLKTRGDKILDRALSEVGGKGLFVKEIEEALLDGRADVAVHSMKDLPAEVPPELVIAAIPEREDPRDALLVRPGLSARTVAELPSGARLGTSSLRRMCQLRAGRSDLDIVPLRGNVDTRLRKLQAGELDAIVLACAGLKRLGYGEHITAAIDPKESLPAIGQGALAIECRVSDAATRAQVEKLNHAETNRCVTAERAFLARLEGGCQTPLAAHARLDGDGVLLEGLVGAPDGSRILRETLRGTDAARVGRELAEQLLAQGADQILAGQKAIM